MTWERIKRLADDWLPKPRILHPWPERRFAVRHPRWEPCARIGPHGSVRGARGNSRPYRESRTSGPSGPLMTRNGSRAQRRKVSPSIFVWAIPDFDEARMIRLAC